MMEIILALLAPFWGKIALIAGVLIALVTAYFGIKHRGKREADERWERDLARAKADQLKRQLEAVSQDDLIDKKVKRQIDDIKRLENEDPNPHPRISGDKFRF